MNQSIINKLKIHKSELWRKYNILSLGIFGSYARGDEKKNSDVDVLVEYKKTPGFFQFLDLENELIEILNKKIDLTTVPSLKPLIKDKILKETIYI